MTAASGTERDRGTPVDPAERVGPRSPAGGLEDAVDEVERQFATLMSGARRRMRDYAALVHPDLTPLGFTILVLLRQCPPLPQSELAQQLHADKGAVSRSVTQLEDLGLVTRTPAPDDRRVALVALTEAARQSLVGITERQRGLLHDRVSAWRVAEVRQLGDLLARLNEFPPAPPAG